MKSTLCLTKHQVWLDAIFTSAIDEDEWSASRPGLFTLRETAPDTH